MAETNSTIMASVWLKASNDFQHRVPDPTQAGIASTVAAIIDPLNQDLWNQFVDTLVKRIGMTKVNAMQWENPLREFKGASLLYGSSIQEILPKWIKAHAYNFDSTLLDVHRPEAAEWFHSINRFDKYPISINDIEIRKSFTDDYGLNQLVTGFLQQPVNADEYDEYRIMLQLIAEYENRWGFYKYNLEADPKTEAGAKELMTAIRTLTGRLKFPSQLYNAGIIDVPVFVRDPTELMLITTPDVEAYMDVNVLSSLFHVELADIDVRRIIVDELPVPNAVALLTTKDWFVCHDTVKQMTSFFDGSNLTTNYWYHRQGVYSMSPMVPAIMITHGAESTVVPVYENKPTALTVTPDTATVKPGDTLQLQPSITGTTDPATSPIDGKANDVVPDSVTYTLSSADGTHFNSRTYVDRYNVLHMQKTAVTGEELTITATSTYVNPSGATTPLTATVTVTVG